IELMKNLPRNEDNPLPPWYFEIFDRSGGTTPIICIDDLINERESAEAADLGVHSTGAEGLADLYEVCRELRTKYQSVSLDESDEQLLATSALARSVFAAVVGFDDTEYGSSGDDEIRTLCEEYVKHKQAGDIRELEHGYEPSRIYDVPKKGDSSGPLITEDVLDRYEILRDDMEAAEIAMDEQFGLGLLVDRVKQAAAKTATVMEDDIAALDTDDSKFEIKYRNMKQRHQVLNDYLSSLEYGDKTSSRFVMNSSIEVQRGIEALAGFGDVHPAMRQLIIAWAMHQSPDLASHISNLSFDDPSVDDVESMWLIVDQIQTQIYGSHFDNPRIKQQFLRIMSVVSLEKEIARHEKLKEKGKTTGLQFVPSKGIFFEASGQIAGACWAGQFDSINLQMPNMSSIIMRARPGAKTERIVGAALLIETTDIDTGEGVLVLRGLNPSENYISKVNIKAFYDATVDYVKQIANNRGLIPAIAIDDHSGGAGTNREKLFDYIEDLDFDDFEERIYVDDNDSTFNGYDISNMTYAL
ncbi:MAG: hypothetical protein ABIP74_05000, partial [Candidatus Saccharimonas sp.]